MTIQHREPEAVKDVVVLSKDDYIELLKSRRELLALQSGEKNTGTAGKVNRHQDFYYLYAAITKSLAVRAITGQPLLAADCLILQELNQYQDVSKISSLIEYSEEEIEVLLELAEEVN